MNAEVGKFYEWREAPIAEFAVIGDPVLHSRSPPMQTAALESLKLNYRYLAIRVPLNEFNEAIEHLKKIGYIGLNVTTPLKEAAAKWTQVFENESKQYQSVNTLNLAKRSAINTDVPGFFDTLNKFEIGKGSPILLLGAGGSSKALAKAFSDKKYPLYIYNRTRDRAQMLKKELKLNATVIDSPNAPDAKVIINATTTGTLGVSLPIDWRLFGPHALAYDLVYSAKQTSFLKDASQAGLRTVDGRYLLVAQGARSLEWWLNIKAPREIMLDTVTQHLSKQGIL